MKVRKEERCDILTRELIYTLVEPKNIFPTLLVALLSTDCSYHYHTQNFNETVPDLNRKFPLEVHCGPFTAPPSINTLLRTK